MKEEQRKDYIVNVVCDFFNTSLEKISRNSNPTKKIEYCYPRQVLCYCLRMFTFMGVRDVGKLLGIDHGTVTHSVKIITRDLPQGMRATRTYVYPDIRPIVNRFELVLNRKEPVHKLREKIEKWKNELRQMIYEYHTRSQDQWYAKIIEERKSEW